MPYSTKKGWNPVGLEIVKAVHNFFKSNYLLKELNATFVVLILKTKGAKVFNEFRPISLCNVVCKLMSKILANRLRGVMNNLMSPIQSTFIPSRWIVENSILA